MIRKLQIDGLVSERAALQSMLLAIPAHEYANRMGLESRLEEVESEIALLGQSPPEVWAKAGLFFGGAPVMGSIGIDSEFASEAVRQYQDLVSTLAASQRRGGQLASTGPIPDRKDSRLHITGTLHGSFGFELEELGSQEYDNPLFDKSALATTVDKATKIIAAAGESDEAFSDAIADVDERVAASVRDFFRLLKQRRATFRIVADRQDMSFDHGAIARAAERTNVTVSAEEDVPLQCEFLGAYPARRSFEMYDENKHVIHGDISREMTEDEIILLNRQWSGERCVAHVRVVRVNRTGAPEQVRFTLLRIEPKPILGSKDATSPV